MGKKRAIITYGVDVDAISGWIGSYGGQDSAGDIARGMVARLNLQLISQMVLTQVWFDIRLVWRYHRCRANAQSLCQV